MDKCKSYLTRVDWPRAVAERCGQASGEAQKGTLRVSNIEGYIDRVISFYKDTTAQDLGPVKTDGRDSIIEIIIGKGARKVV